MLPLPDTPSVLVQAAAGELTTCVGDTTVAVRLSIHGYARLGLYAPMTDHPTHVATERPDGSANGSKAGSRDAVGKLFNIGAQEGTNRIEDVSAAVIAWDVGMIHESTNHDSTADHVRSGGGRSRGCGDYQAAAHALSRPVVAASTEPLVELPLRDLIPAALDSAVVTGHRLLNPERTLRAGEWLELLALQTAYSAEQILIWQARAGRSTVERPFGVTPAYYHACAPGAAGAVGLPRRAHEATALVAGHQPNDTQPGGPALDPRCSALLRAMGVRERQTLTAIPLALIETWSEIIAHPGLLARFDSPIGFAVRQMRQGQLPPEGAELDRWAARATRAADRYDTYRHMAAPARCEGSAAVERNLEARIRAIAPPGIDIADLCRLADWLEQGATEADALARLAAGYGGDSA
jgi:hypothetical protein